MMKKKGNINGLEMMRKAYAGKALYERREQF